MEGKSVALVGAFGYHERNITQPLVEALMNGGCTVTRVAQHSNDFFTADGRGCSTDLVRELSHSDVSEAEIVLCLDWWMPALPYFLFRVRRNQRLVGLFHGGACLPFDVSDHMRAGAHYEQFLFHCFDRVILPAEWLRSFYHGQMFSVAPFPFSNQFRRDAVPQKPAMRVIYAHRWQQDKGYEAFLNFAEKAVPAGIECIVTDMDAMTHPDVKRIGIVVTGWLDQDRLKELCRAGGYAWSSAVQETWGYAVMDLISYGLVPLVHHHPAYSAIPEGFKWRTPAEAMEVVANKRSLPKDWWEKQKKKHAHNASLLAWSVVDA